MDDFDDLVETSFDEHLLRHEGSHAYLVREWLISPFHYDSTDDSWWWLEMNYNGTERLGWTGHGKRGVWVTGHQVAVETIVLDSPDAETARGMYVHSLTLLDRSTGELPAAYEEC